MSQLCQGSCEPCQTFPDAVQRISNSPACHPTYALTLMKITVLLIRSLLSEPAVRRAAVVVNVTQPPDDRRQKALVNVTRWEVRVAEVRLLIVVVQIEFVRLCQLVIWRYNGDSDEKLRPRGSGRVTHLRCCPLNSIVVSAYHGDRRYTLYIPKMTTEGWCLNLFTFCSASSSTDFVKESYAGYW